MIGKTHLLLQWDEYYWGEVCVKWREVGDYFGIECGRGIDWMAE